MPMLMGILVANMLLLLYIYEIKQYVALVLSGRTFLNWLGNKKEKKFRKAKVDRGLEQMCIHN